MNTKKSKTLTEKIKNYEFHPEVYVYPTPRVYEPMNNFSLQQPDFGNELNVYVHIPFCKQTCSYCGYLKMVGNGRLQEAYVDALVREIRMYRKILQEKTIKTLNFGGGTPSLLTLQQFTKIMNTLLEINTHLLRTADEVSIEATPESVEYDKFSAFKDLGINRVSIGVQTLNNVEIALSERKNLADDAVKAIEILQAIGIPNVVADLMSGIEAQTVKSFAESVYDLIELRPDTVEVYALGLKPFTKLGTKTPQLMSNQGLYECYDVARNIFLSSGYKQDCHNRYAIPGKGGYVQEDNVFKGQSVLGFGAGARSYATNIHYRNDFYLDNHAKAVFDYIGKINSGEFSVTSSVFLDLEEKTRQYAIYNIEYLDKNEFKNIFGIGFEKKFAPIYEELLALGLTEEYQDKLKLTQKGLDFRDLIAKELFSEKVRQAEEAYRP